MASKSDCHRNKTDMKESKINRSYGWKPQLPDHRDRMFLPRVSQPSKPTTDLRPQMPSVYDQGQLGSCTANSIAADVQYDLIRQGLPAFPPSRLFIYYNERNMEGTVGQDAGAVIRDGIKSINALGVCDEVLWPYVESQFTVKPPQICYDQASTTKALQYEAVNQDLESIKQALTQGTPVVIGFTVYESFESLVVAQSGIMPMPGPDESVLGGHAVLIVGANDSQSPLNGCPPQCFIVRNSWGTSWGASGYFYAPFGYFTNPNLASDLWAIQVMA